MALSFLEALNELDDKGKVPTRKRAESFAEALNELDPPSASDKKVVKITQSQSLMKSSQSLSHSKTTQSYSLMGSMKSRNEGSKSPRRSSWLANPRPTPNAHHPRAYSQGTFAPQRSFTRTKEYVGTRGSILRGPVRTGSNQHLSRENSNNTSQLSTSRASSGTARISRMSSGFRRTLTTESRVSLSRRDPDPEEITAHREVHRAGVINLMALHRSASFSTLHTVLKTELTEETNAPSQQESKAPPQRRRASFPGPDYGFNGLVILKSACDISLYGLYVEPRDEDGCPEPKEARRGRPELKGRPDSDGDKKSVRSLTPGRKIVVAKDSWVIMKTPFPRSSALKAKRLFAQPAFSRSREDIWMPKAPLVATRLSAEDFTILHVLYNPRGRFLLRKHLESERNVEGLDFWEATENFKSLRNQELLQACGTRIIKRFIDNCCPDPVNISSVTRNRILRDFKQQQINPHIFEVARTEILLLIKKDPFRRFRKSKYFTTLTGHDIGSDTNATTLASRSDPTTAKEGLVEPPPISSSRMNSWRERKRRSPTISLMASPSPKGSHTNSVRSRGSDDSKAAKISNSKKDKKRNIFSSFKPLKVMASMFKGKKKWNRRASKSPGRYGTVDFSSSPPRKPKRIFRFASKIESRPATTFDIDTDGKGMLPVLSPSGRRGSGGWSPTSPERRRKSFLNPQVREHQLSATAPVSPAYRHRRNKTCAAFKYDF
ncbi:hypothetical protein AAMO2058_000085200 [Amorphochlora amoebiformis]